MYLLRILPGCMPCGRYRLRTKLLKCDNISRITVLQQRKAVSKRRQMVASTGPKYLNSNQKLIWILCWIDIYILFLTYLSLTYLLNILQFLNIFNWQIKLIVKFHFKCFDFNKPKSKCIKFITFSISYVKKYNYSIRLLSQTQSNSSQTQIQGAKISWKVRWYESYEWSPHYPWKYISGQCLK